MTFPGTVMPEKKNADVFLICRLVSFGTRLAADGQRRRFGI